MRLRLPLDPFKKFNIPTLSSLILEEGMESLLKGYPYAFFKQHAFIPFGRTVKGFRLAISNPFDIEGLEEIEKMLKVPLEIYGISQEKIYEVLDQIYHQKEKLDETLLKSWVTTPSFESLNLQDPSQIASVLEGILKEGIDRKASDIHLEPFEKHFGIRLRVEGHLIPLYEVPKRLGECLMGRL